MFQKILVAIDGSEPAWHALGKGIEDAKLRNAELHAIYVVETGRFSSLPMDGTMEVIYSLLQREGEDLLAAGQKKAEAAGVALITHIRQGHAGTEILTLAEEIRADLIIMGSQGKSGVDRILLGSVSDHVVRHSSITTMVVRV